MELTGFGVLWRVKGTSWQYDDAVDVVDDDQRYTMRGLLPSTTYEVIVQSCNGDDSCSPWNDPNDPVEFTTPPGSTPTPTATATPTTVMAPAQVTGLSFPTADLTHNQFKVTWTAPDDGGADITRYEVLKRQSGSSWPSDDNADGVESANPPDAPLTFKTYTGQAASTTYVVKVRACNHAIDTTPKRCGSWSADGRATTLSTPVTIVAPGPVTAISFPDADIQHNAFKVAWKAPISNGGSPITHYHVQRVSGWPANVNGTTDVVRNKLSETYTGLTPTTTYAVKVRACNDPGGCGEWVDAQVMTALPPPSNLTVIPHPGLRATLRWDAITVPTGKSVDYILEIRATAEPGSDWPPLETADRNRHSRSSGNYHLNLLEIIMLDTAGSTHAKGLGHDPHSYEIRVKAIDRETLNSRPQNPIPDSPYSNRVVLIDSPIYDADGAAPASGNPSVSLSWIAIEKLFPRSGYGIGQYEFGYRKLSSDADHTLRDWIPDETAPTITYSPPHEQITPSTIGDTDVKMASFSSDNLTKSEIYGIQFKYFQTGKPTVYAARDVYAWISSERPDDGSRIATVPVRKRLTEKIYSYRICEDTFVNGTPEHWRALIRHALDQWEKAPSHWGLLPNIITMAHDEVYTAVDVAENPDVGLEAIGMKKPCAEYATFVKYVVMRMNNVSVADHNTFIEDLIVSLKLTGLFGTILQQVQDEDAVFAEIAMEDHTSTAHESLAAVSVFPHLARELGFSWCWVTDNKLNIAKACVIPNIDGLSSKADIYLRASAFVGDRIRIPGGDASVDKSDTYLLHSRSEYDAYCVLVHEAGHAVGLADAADGEGQEVNHASMSDSAVADSRSTSMHCSPTPFDVLAIRSLYRD